MISISKEFAPPLKLVFPYFIVGALNYFVSILMAFFFDMSSTHSQDPYVLAWVHLFLIGFVMMIIIGSMAQLVPVVLEVGHFSVDFFYLIWPLLYIGTVMMALGFVWSPSVLPYGGGMVFIALLIYLLDIFITLRQVERFNLSVVSIVIANIFLLCGLTIGMIMALGYTGLIGVDIYALLRGHVYLIIGGYIFITVMGISMVLLPMFGLSHHFSTKPVKIAIWLMSIAVLLVSLSSLIEISILKYSGYIFGAISLLIYMIQIVILYLSRARKEHDIYVKSLIFSFLSLIASVVLYGFYMYSDFMPALLASGWVLFTGFFGFLITGHLYKIIPFLVWFERFSPLVGKKKVPMLVDMLPDKSTYVQFFYTAFGIFLSMVGILGESSMLFHGGISFMVVGSLFLIHVILFIGRYE